MAERVPFADFRIRVWMPMDEGQPCIALIDHCPLIFKGPTPFAVHRAAEKWRQAEIAKAERAKDNAARRVAAMRAAREARKAEGQ